MQDGQRRSGILQPWVNLVREQYQRHPVVDIRYGWIGRRGQDYIAWLTLVYPVQSRHIQRVAGLIKAYLVFVRVPLIKPCRRNDTPPSLQARAEGRLILRRLSPGIDDDAFAIKIGETPTKQISQPPSFPV